jgi:hypothetical protein
MQFPAQQDGRTQTARYKFGECNNGEIMNIWESKEQPERLFRLQGFLNLTRNVQPVTRTDENGNDETFYTYEVIRLNDRPMPADVDAFLVQNYAEIRQAVIMSSWPQQAQNEAITENAMGRPDNLNAFKTFIESVKTEFPKE